MKFDPTQARDLILGDEAEPAGFVRESAIRNLVARGWPAEAILAEIPGVSEAEVRRVLEAAERSAAA